MKCKEVYHEICDSLDQDLNSPRCREIKKHLETCPDCAQFLNSMKKTVMLYRTVPTPEVTSAVHKRLTSALNQVRRTSSPRRLGGSGLVVKTRSSRKGSGAQTRTR